MAPFASYLVFGKVFSSKGSVVPSAKLVVVTSVGRKVYITDSSGLFLYDLADIGYVSGETVIVNVTEPFNNELKTQSYVVSGDFLEDNIILALRTRVEHISELQTQNVLHSVGKKPITSDNPLSVNVYNELFTAKVYLSEHVKNGVNEDMAVNGTTPVIYSYVVPSNKRLFLLRCFITLEDGGSAFAPGVFAALGSALANGVEISITSRGTKYVLENWKTNRQLRDTFFDFDQSFKTNGIYTGRWTFTKDINSGGLVMFAGDKFEVKIRDNLSGLDFFDIRLKGRLEEDV